MHGGTFARYVLPALVGAALLTGWEVLFWTRIQAYASPPAGVPNGVEVARLLAGSELGVYEHPTIPSPDNGIRWEDYQRHLRTSPRLIITYIPASESQDTSPLTVLGLFFTFLSLCLLAVWMAVSAHAYAWPFGKRLFFLWIPGVILGLEPVGALTSWNGGFLGDEALNLQHSLVGWLLGALGMAIMIGRLRPPRPVRLPDVDDGED